ncbi:unnamed protein product, partial [Brenthis ino]
MDIYKFRECSLVIKILFCLIFLQFSRCDELCDRRPLKTKTDPLPPDNRFQIDIIGISDDLYIPNNKYVVRLFSTDSISTFIAFTISARGESLFKDINPRKETILNAGRIEVPEHSRDAMNAPICTNSVIQTDITPKISVEVIWKAPPKNNKCVTIFAVLAVRPDVWYNFDGPLSKRVCEDRRNMEDMQPTENNNCITCEDARYLLTFDGIWSFNTHPYMFPSSRELARFSDVVGASHNNNFKLYRFNSDASEGLKMLAEQGNTTKLELEILKQLGISVRTLLKASGQPKPNMKTTAMFRVTREHHLVSLVAAILPSPDWFVGVSNMELCDVASGTWAPNLTLNIYASDAGTDSGLTFEATNEETMPPQPIESAEINKTISKENIKPFAKLRFELLRTYTTAACSTEATETTTEENKEEINRDDNDVITTTTPSHQYRPRPTSAVSDEECSLSDWEEWLPCENECVDGVIENGTQIRFRYHMNNGVITKDREEISDYCWENYSTFEMRPCTAEC